MDSFPELSAVSGPDLESPVMLAAFRGWNDAGEAATFAAAHLARVWSTQLLATVDPEDFYDFQAVRPQVELTDGLQRAVSWPSNEFSAARLPGTPHDVIILIGTEPNLRWRRFSELVSSVARHHGAHLVVTMGALLADVAHSRPTPITGTADNDDLVSELDLQRSRYEGPTGIVGVVHDTLSRSGIRSASLWAAVPHYLAVSPNPKAALALVERATSLVGAQADTNELERASDVYESRVSEMVSQDEDVSAYVKMLEQRADAPTDIDEVPIPSGDALAAELERFLQERNDGDGGRSV
jgi:proteasome assembly chaperone (PAC2) family protein